MQDVLLEQPLEVDRAEMLTALPSPIHPKRPQRQRHLMALSRLQEPFEDFGREQCQAQDEDHVG